MTIGDLQACDPLGQGPQTDAAAALKGKLENVDVTHARALFPRRTLRFLPSLPCFLSFCRLVPHVARLCSARSTFLRPVISTLRQYLPYLQAIRGAKFGTGSAYIMYRNSLIVAAIAMFANLFAPRSWSSGGHSAVRAAMCKITTGEGTRQLFWVHPYSQR